MSNQVFKGKITQIMQLREGTTQAGDAWKSIEFLVEELEPNNPAYPETVKFAMFGKGEQMEKVEKFIKYRKVGDTVDVSYNFRTREHNGNFYTEVSAWKVWSESRAQDENAAPMPVYDEPTPVDEEDDLPF